MNAAFIALLLGTAPLTDLVGLRINWGVLPEDERARPYVILHQVGGGRGYTLEGARAWKQARVQIDVWADTVDDVCAVWGAIEVKLSGYKGALGGVEFSMVRLEGDRSMDSRSNGPPRLHGRSGDYVFSWRDLS